MRKAATTRSASQQLTLSLFDTTALAGLSLDGAGPLRRATVPVPIVAVLDEDHAPQPVAQAATAPARNFRLEGDRGLAAGWKARATDNLAAIRLMQRIEAEGRPATADEQAVLARFTGFGATELANACFRRPGEAWRPGWEEIGGALEEELSREELAGLKRATQYAHYTPEFLARAVWRALERLGFAGGAALEPGCGTGLFLSLLPEALAPRTALTGVENDPVTARRQAAPSPPPPHWAGWWQTRPRRAPLAPPADPGSRKNNAKPPTTDASKGSWLAGFGGRGGTIGDVGRAAQER